MVTLSRVDTVPGVEAGAKLSVAEIFTMHRDFVWRMLGHLGVAQAEREDALQEVFVIVHRRIGSYREQDKLRSWLYAISARVAQQYRRKSALRRERTGDTQPEPSHSVTPARELAHDRGLALAQRMLAALPAEQAEVFLLYEVEQLSMPEVAAAIGCRLATAHTRLRLARARVLALVARANLRGEIP